MSVLDTKHIKNQKRLKYLSQNNAIFLRIGIKKN